jgi:DNA-binding transcriptional ArsR family regulator
MLAATLLHPDRWWYLSDLARHLGVRPSSLQRELATLASADILRQRREGKRVYFRANPDCPFLADLQGLLLKTAGLVDVLREALGPVTGQIAWAFVHGALARGEALATSPVDLLIIGEVARADLAPALSQAERSLDRPVQPTVYTPAEFAAALAAGHAVWRNVLDGAKLFVFGNPEELAVTFRAEP